MSANYSAKGDANSEMHMEFPGGRVPFSPDLQFTGGPLTERSTLPCYRTIDSTGKQLPGAHIPHPLQESTALQMYKTMISLLTVDTIFYEAQRQARVLMLL